MEAVDSLREVLSILQNRIENPNATHGVTSDLKECYNTISSSIDALEKEISPSISSDEKPDFKKLGDDYYNSTPVNHIGVTSFDYAAGCEKIWNDYVLPFQKELFELKAKK